MVDVLLLAILWMQFGITTGLIYQGNQRSFGTGVFLGILLGPLGVLIALLTGPSQFSDSYLISHGKLRRCPYCMEGVRFEACVCKHCHRDLPPVEVTV